MTSLRRVLSAPLLAPLLAALLAPLLALATLAAGAAVVPAHAELAFPVQCELGSETVLPWDDVTYDLQGTCGVVRVTADDATVTMPAATRLVVEGTGNTVTAKPLGAVEVTGAGSSVTAPSITSLVLTGAGSTVSATGLVEQAVLSGTGCDLTADTINVLRLRGSDSVTARKAYRTRVTGSDNVARFRRAEKLVVLGDRNGVSVERGRTTVRDKGSDNVLDLRRRKRP